MDILGHSQMGDLGLIEGPDALGGHSACSWELGASFCLWELWGREKCVGVPSSETASASPLRLGVDGEYQQGVRLQFPRLSHPEPGQQRQALRPL